MNIKHIISLEKLQKQTGVTTSKHFQEIIFPANSFHAGYQKYLDILQDFQNDRRNLLSRMLDVIETIHSVTAIPIITKLIVEIEEAFNTNDFPVINAFHTFDPKNIPTIVLLNYSLNKAKIIYCNYGNNKVNIYQEYRHVASAILK